jgi:hypothetical protein
MIKNLEVVTATPNYTIVSGLVQRTDGTWLVQQTTGSDLSDAVRRLSAWSVRMNQPETIEAIAQHLSDIRRFGSH